MQYSDFQGMEAPSFAMLAALPDDSETTLSDTEPGHNRNETDDCRTWNWSEAATAIGVNESTLRKVWWEDTLAPAFRDCPTPLRVITRTVKKSGRQLEEFTAFGLQVLQTYKAAKETSDRTAALFLAEARAKFPPLPTANDLTGAQAVAKPAKVTVEVEAGNHKVVVAPPNLPQSYTLESLRQIESVEIADPLAIATQFLDAADQVQTAMQQDIEQREHKLQQTRQAKTAIAAKAQELKLEQRLYRERANQVAAQTSEETQALQAALSTLQGLGKSTVAPTG